jgi:hypothetical protein
MAEREDRSISPVRAGQLATFEVGGGFVRLPAPCHGIIVETKTTTIFIPAADVAAALARLPKERGQSRPPPPQAKTLGR